MTSLLQIRWCSFNPVWQLRTMFSLSITTVRVDTEGITSSLDSLTWRATFFSSAIRSSSISYRFMRPRGFSLGSTWTPTCKEEHTDMNIATMGAVDFRGSSYSQRRSENLLLLYLSHGPERWRPCQFWSPPLSSTRLLLLAYRSASVKGWIGDPRSGRSARSSSQSIWILAWPHPYWLA